MILSVKNLCLQRGKHVLCQDISFLVRSGQGITLKGPNGSGKTTLLCYLAGLIPSAQVHVFEKTLFLPSEYGLYPNLTVQENLVFFQALLGKQNKKHRRNSLKNALESFDLQTFQHRYVQSLSTGQKRRVSLARLFLSDAVLWLLDEPDQGMDNQYCERLNQHLKTHLEKGGAYVLATHSREFEGTDSLDFSFKNAA